MWRQTHRETDTIWSWALSMGRLQRRLQAPLLQRQTGKWPLSTTGFLGCELMASRRGTGSFCSWLILLHEGTDGLKVNGSGPWVSVAICCELLQLTECSSSHCSLGVLLLMCVTPLLSSGQTHLSLDGQSQKRSFWLFLAVFLWLW